MSENNRKFNLLETVDKRRLGYIINNPLKFNLGKSYVGKLVDNEAQLTLFKEYFYALDDKGTRKMSYIQRHNMGRYWSKSFSIANMSRVVRHTICKDFYYDLDMKNAHGVIFQHYCNSNKIKCKYVDHYCKNREECLNELMVAIESKSRDEAKKIPLAIINGRDYNNTPYINESGKIIEFEKFPQWLQLYQANMPSIHKKIVELNPDLYEIAKENKKDRRGYNTTGSAVNLVLCNMENKCLMIMYDWLIKHNYKVGSLMYDGLVIYKDCVKNGIEEVHRILKECEKEIFKNVGIRIKLSEKSMKEGLTITENDMIGYNDEGMLTFFNPDGTYDQKWMLDEMTYEDFKSKWEQICFFCLSTGLYMVRDSRANMMNLTPGELKTRYSHYTYVAKKIKKDKEIEISKSFVIDWMNDRNKKLYEFCEINPFPIKTDSRTFNLWTGFEHDRNSEPGDSKSEYVDQWLDFIKALFKSEEEFDYINNWIANIIQYPGLKPAGAALLLYSRENGSGKNTLTSGITALLGSNLCFQTCDPQNYLFGNFNKERLNRLLIVVDEANAMTSFCNSDKIKSIITERYFTVNEKSKTTYVSKCLARFIFTTNNMISMKIDPEDRRFAVFEVSGKLVGNVDYFNSMYNMFENINAMGDIFQFYKNFKITINIVNERPNTEMMNLIQKANIDPFDRWIAEFISTLNEPLRVTVDNIKNKPTEPCNPKISKDEYIPEEGRYIFKAKKLFNLYNEYLTNNNFQKIVTSKKFYSQLRVLYDDGFNSKIPGIERVNIKNLAYISVKKEIALPHVTKWLD